MMITYDGRRLNRDHLGKVIRVLNRLLHWCPANSFLSAVVSENETDFRLRIQIRSQSKVFEAVASGDDFEGVTSAAAQDISAQVKEWRQRRFFEKPGRVLVVDDDPDAIQVLEGCFQNLGWQTESMSSGTEIIRELPRIPKDFNLLVIDIVMPILDGLGTLAAVEKLVEKTYGLTNWKDVRLPYLTYSVKPAKDLLPRMDSECFFYLGHLQKGGTLSILENKIKSLISTVYVRGDSPEEFDFQSRLDLRPSGL
ncbi:MAG: hypothetical protein A4S09_15780 [Proteobacteria bacterium SG_bin7]|nr:MAG: hypothetical protein A4S09_15780 [Proteobacteria bacterium SG_bin7]